MSHVYIAVITENVMLHSLYSMLHSLQSFAFMLHS